MTPSFLRAAGLLCSWALFCSAAAAQDLSVSATVDRTTVGVQGQVTYTLRVEGVGRNEIRTPSAPDASGLTLVRPQPDVDHRLSYDGGIRQSHSFQWTYRPSGTGRARIAAARVTVGGRSYETAPIDVQVVSGTPPPPASGGGETGDEGAASTADGITDRDLFIRASASTRSPYLNEQVILEYRLFFRYGLRIRESVLADSWDADGFWREELKVDPAPVAQLTTIDGERFATILLKRVALFPTRTGRLQIEPLRIETEAFAPYGSGLDPLYSLSREAHRLRIASPTVTVDVKPLPPDAPADFNGAVGSFRMQASAPQAVARVGDPVEVTATISGSGNFSTMQPPAFDVPEAFEPYEPQAEVTISREGTRVTGSKTFTFTAVAAEPGTYGLPPVSFSYLDPETGRYETLRSQPAEIVVSGTAARSAAERATAALPPNDIGGLMAAESGWVRIDRAPLYRSVWPYALLGLSATAVGIAYAVRRTRTRSRTASDRRRPRTHRLGAGGDPRTFYAGVEQSLLEHVGRRFGLPERGLSRRELDAALSEAGVPEATRAALDGLLRECDRARFAPSSVDSETFRTAAVRAEAVLTELDRTPPRNAAPPGR